MGKLKFVAGEGSRRRAWLPFLIYKMVRAKELFFSSGLEQTMKLLMFSRHLVVESVWCIHLKIEGAPGHSSTMTIEEGIGTDPEALILISTDHRVHLSLSCFPYKSYYLYFTIFHYPLIHNYCRIVNVSKRQVKLSSLSRMAPTTVSGYWMVFQTADCLDWIFSCHKWPLFSYNLPFSPT